MTLRLFGVLAAIVCATACESSGRAEQAAAAKPALEECRDAWSGLTPLAARAGNAPWMLSWRDGMLYYRETTDSTRPLLALPDTGGEPSALSEVTGGWGPWIEDDSLLYTHYDRLYSVPIAGGESTLIADGGTFGPETVMRENVVFTHIALDASSYYWVLHRNGEPTRTVWRLPRAGGSSEQLGVLPDAAAITTELVALPDALMFAGIEGDVYVMPKDGGDVKALPTIADQLEHVTWSNFLGAAQSGVLWNVSRQVDQQGTKAAYELVLVTPEGDIQRVWADKPSELRFDDAWSDGDGGWILTGTEPFADGERHASVWSVDAEDRARRLACDEEAGSASGYATAAAVGGDAVYLVVEYLDPSPANSLTVAEGTGWKLVKVGK